VQPPPQPIGEIVLERVERDNVPGLLGLVSERHRLQVVGARLNGRQLAAMTQSKGAPLECYLWFCPSYGHSLVALLETLAKLSCMPITVNVRRFVWKLAVKKPD